jgi:hypothetical protein
MKTTPKEKLRKCQVRYYNLYPKPDVTYLAFFHGWGQRGTKKLHPEDPQKDCVYAETLAIAENIETGEVTMESPDSITFLN